MTLPKLAVPASGFGGRGYKHPNSGLLVPSVTTVLKAEAKPAATQWAVDQTVGYAVANVDQLMRMSEERGFKFLRWYHKREPKLTAESNIDNWHEGVLDDLAELGTSIHEWIQAEVTGTSDYPDVSNQPPQFWQMVEAWDEWKKDHTIKPHHTETTVFDQVNGYAGTADLMWEIDGEYTLGDIKTARNIYSSHKMQLAALYKAPELLFDLDGENYAEVTAWAEPITKMGFLKVRPDEVDVKTGELIPRHVKWIDMTEAQMDGYHKAFLGLLQYTYGIKEGDRA